MRLRSSCDRCGCTKATSTAEADRLIINQCFSRCERAHLASASPASSSSSSASPASPASSLTLPCLPRSSTTISPVVLERVLAPRDPVVVPPIVTGTGPATSSGRRAEATRKTPPKRCSLRSGEVWTSRANSRMPSLSCTKESFTENRDSKVVGRYASMSFANSTEEGCRAVRGQTTTM